MNFFRVFYSRWIQSCRPWIFLLLMMSMLRPSLAYDNSVFPPFEMNKVGRGFNQISIHPDGEHWLISECSDRINPSQPSCYLFLYNYKNQSYQRYDLDSGYQYTDPQFSPTGRWIVSVRTKLPQTESYEALVRSYVESEILMFRMDGTDLRVLPVPKGRIKSPVMSPDENKVAYWMSGRVRSAGAKTTFTDFDIHEFDLVSEKDSLFAGPYRFFLADGLQFKTHDMIVASAYGPAAFASDMGAYREKFGTSEIYLFKRGARDLPAPAFSTIASATSPTITKDARMYLLGSPWPHGMSIVEAGDESYLKRWRIPRLSDQAITSITVAPSGSYIVFIYPTTPIRSAEPKNNLGLFDLSLESWIPVSIPPPDAATGRRLRD